MAEMLPKQLISKPIQDYSPANQPQISSINIFPIPQIKQSKLYTIKSEHSNKYIFSQFPNTKIKEQFRQIKRINGFIAREKERPSISLQDLPKTIINSHNPNENCAFRVTNLRKLTFHWRSLLGLTELSYIALVKNIKRVINFPKSSQQKQIGSAVSISDHYFELLPQIFKNLFQKRLKLESISFSYKSLRKIWQNPQKDQKSFFNKINNSLQKFYCLRKISIGNILNTDILQNDLNTVLIRNQNLQKISLEFNCQEKDQVNNKINPQMPFLDFFDSGKIILSKASQEFQIIEAEINASHILPINTLENMRNFQFLISLALNQYDSFRRCQNINFENVILVFEKIGSFQCLENLSLTLSTGLKKEDNFPELGRLVGMCKQLKYFQLEFREENVKGFDSLSFIQNALLTTKTLEEIDLKFYLPQNNFEYFNIGNLKLKEDVSFLTLKKLTLQLRTSNKDLQNFQNLNSLLQSTPNLVELSLNMKEIILIPGLLDAFSPSFKTLKKLKELELISPNDKITSESEVIRLWDSINQNSQLKYLKFNFYGRFFQDNLPIGFFNKGFENKIDDLLSLDICLGSPLLTEPAKIVKLCSQTYKNLQKICINFSFQYIKPNQAFKIGHHLTLFKK